MGWEVAQIQKYRQNEWLGILGRKKLGLYAIWLRLMLNMMSTKKTKINSEQQGEEFMFPTHWAFWSPILFTTNSFSSFPPGTYNPASMAGGRSVRRSLWVWLGYVRQRGLRANHELIRAHFKAAHMKLAPSSSPSCTQNWKDTLDAFLASYSLTHTTILYACAKFHMPSRLLI